MTINNTTRTESVLVNINTTKNRNEVLLGIADKKRRRQLTIVNTRSNFESLTKLL